MNANPDPLVSLSNRTAELTATSGAHVVRVEGRRRSPSSGVAWSKDLVITTHHALERDEEVEVGLPDGGTAPAAGCALTAVATDDVGAQTTTAPVVLKVEWRMAGV